VTDGKSIVYSCCHGKGYVWGSDSYMVILGFCTLNLHHFDDNIDVSTDPVSWSCKSSKNKKVLKHGWQRLFEI